MKIGLIVTDISKVGGCERVAVNMANGLVGKNNIDIISIFQRTAIPYDINNGIRVFILQEGFVRFRQNMRKILMKMREIIKTEQYDILCFINSGTYIVSFGLIGLKVKKIGCEHTNLCNKYHTKSLMQKFLRKWSTIYFDHIVTLTDADKNEYQRKYRINKVTRIYNWIPESVVNYHKKADINSHKIISVGRFDRVKGYENLVTVANKILHKHTDWEWHIYGSGDSKYREEIVQQIIDVGIEDKLIIHEAVDNIYEKYCESSILVLTSYYEGLPMVLLESLAFNLPMVAFDCKTGPNEIINNDVTGYLIPCYDLECMETKINYLIENETIRKKMANQCHYFYDKFEIKNVIIEWEKLFEKIVSDI